MKLNEKRCKKCGKTLWQSGPFARRKREGEATHKGPVEMNYCCLNEECADYHKNFVE